MCWDLEEVAGGPRKPELGGRSSAGEELACGHSDNGLVNFSL